MQGALSNWPGTMKGKCIRRRGNAFCIPNVVLRKIACCSVAADSPYFSFTENVGLVQKADNKISLHTARDCTFSLH